MNRGARMEPTVDEDPRVLFITARDGFGLAVRAWHSRHAPALAEPHISAAIDDFLAALD